MSSGALRSRFPSVTKIEPNEIKRRAFFDLGMLTIDIDDPRLTAAEQEALRSIGARIYGARTCG